MIDVSIGFFSKIRENLLQSSKHEEATFPRKFIFVVCFCVHWDNIVEKITEMGGSEKNIKQVDHKREPYAMYIMLCDGDDTRSN